MKAFREEGTYCAHAPWGPTPCWGCRLDARDDPFFDSLVQASRAGGLLAPSGLGADVERVSLQPEVPGHSGTSTPGRILPSSGPEQPRDVA